MRRRLHAGPGHQRRGHRRRRPRRSWPPTTSPTPTSSTTSTGSSRATTATSTPIDPAAVIRGDQSLDGLSSLALADDPLPGYTGPYGPPLERHDAGGRADREQPDGARRLRLRGRLVRARDLRGDPVRDQGRRGRRRPDRPHRLGAGGQRLRHVPVRPRRGRQPAARSARRPARSSRRSPRRSSSTRTSRRASSSSSWTTSPPRTRRSRARSRSGRSRRPAPPTPARSRRPEGHLVRQARASSPSGGGNLVLTDGALRALPEMTAIPPTAINRQTVYAGQVTFQSEDGKTTLKDPLASKPADVAQPGARFNSGGRRQTYEPTPLGFAIQSQDLAGDDKSLRAPVRRRQEGVRAAAGGRVAGTSANAAPVTRRRSTTASRSARSRSATATSASSAACCRSPASSSTTSSASRRTPRPTRATSSPATSSRCR